MTTMQSEPRPFYLPDPDGIDISKQNRLKKNEPDFIPYNNRGRDLYSRLCFNTGVFWLSGFMIGSSGGFVEGWKRAVNPNIRIRFNSVMNAMSKRGSTLGNSLGIIAFMHTSLVGVSEYLQFESYVGDPIITPIFSGSVTGSLFFSMRGVRASMVAGCIGTVVSCGYWYGGSYVYNVILGKGGRY